MQRIIGFALAILALSLPAFAAKNSATITLASPATVGSTKLAAGDYNVSWTGADANVQVTIAQNGKKVVTVPAKLVSAKNGYSSIDTSTVNGVTTVKAIMLDKITLELSAAQ
jgi:hypothetical protein